MLMGGRPPIGVRGGVARIASVGSVVGRASARAQYASVGRRTKSTSRDAIVVAALLRPTVLVEHAAEATAAGYLRAGVRQLDQPRRAARRISWRSARCRVAGAQQLQSGSRSSQDPHTRYQIDG